MNNAMMEAQWRWKRIDNGRACYCEVRMGMHRCIENSMEVMKNHWIAERNMWLFICTYSPAHLRWIEKPFFGKRNFTIFKDIVERLIEWERTASLIVAESDRPVDTRCDINGSLRLSCDCWVVLIPKYTWDELRNQISCEKKYQNSHFASSTFLSLGYHGTLQWLCHLY